MRNVIGHAIAEARYVIGRAVAEVFLTFEKLIDDGMKTLSDERE